MIVAIATFAFFIYFGTFIQWAFDCSFDTALQVSASVTGASLIALIIALR